MNTPTKEDDLKKNEKSEKKCAEVMTKDPVCCLPADTAARAAQLMKEFDVGPIPVVESGETMNHRRQPLSGRNGAPDALRVITAQRYSA
jgi:CBS domain-containing protein